MSGATVKCGPTTIQTSYACRSATNFSESGKDYQAVVTYGWLHRTDEASQLIPLTISTQAEYNKRVYWCRGQFTDYQKFSSRVKIASK